MSAPVADLFIMRDLVVTAGLGSMKDAQDMTRDDLEEIWIAQWEQDPGACRASIRRVRLRDMGA